MVDHDLGLERDRFDPYFDHILLFDDAREINPIIGVYRVMTCEKASKLGEFYSDEEYDLTLPTMERVVWVSNVRDLMEMIIS